MQSIPLTRRQQCCEPQVKIELIYFNWICFSLLTFQRKLRDNFKPKWLIEVKCYGVGPRLTMYGTNTCYTPSIMTRHFQWNFTFKLFNIFWANLFRTGSFTLIIIIQTFTYPLFVNFPWFWDCCKSAHYFCAEDVFLLLANKANKVFSSSFTS